MDVRRGASELESGVVPRYLTISRGLAGSNHSFTLLHAAMESLKKYVQVSFTFFISLAMFQSW